MFRKALLPILCAASFSTAFPLKVGESWVWQVWDRDSTSSTFRMARILGSSPCEQGTVWTILGRDSLTQQQDTGRILERKNGRQSWLRASKLLTFELMPYSPADSDTVVIVGSDTSYQWGQVSSFPELAPSFTYQLVEGRLNSTTKVQSPWIVFQNGSRLEQPRGVWSQEHGMERHLSWSTASAGVEWRLCSRNGKDIELAKPKVLVPGVASFFSWAGSTNSVYSLTIGATAHGSERHFSSVVESGVISWTVKEILPDSGEWKRIQVLEDAHWTRNSSSGNPSPMWRTLTTSLRIQGITGQWFISAGAIFPFHQSWISHWDDSVAEAGNHIQAFSFLSLQRSLGLESQVSRRLYLRNQDSLYSCTSSSKSNIAFESFLNSASFRLEKMVLPPEDSSNIAVLPRNIGRNLSLHELILEHPDLPVRWIRLNGQQGVVQASLLGSAIFPHQHQILLLEARLPDGQVWTNSQVLP